MKYLSTLCLAALIVAIANPALAHCGAGHGKLSHAAPAAKKPAFVGMRTEPVAPATTAQAATSGLATDLQGG